VGVVSLEMFFFSVSEGISVGVPVLLEMFDSFSGFFVGVGFCSVFLVQGWVIGRTAKHLSPLDS
jgi:hypothetical protein